MARQITMVEKMIANACIDLGDEVVGGSELTFWILESAEGSGQSLTLTQSALLLGNSGHTVLFIMVTGAMKIGDSWTDMGCIYSSWTPILKL